MNKITAKEVVKHLNLIPLPTEGGYFNQTWRDEYSTVIYYLVTPDSWSALHRLSIAEVWHFYAGDPLKQLQITDKGRLVRTDFSSNLSAGHRPQLICPADAWQATRLVDGGDWALVGTTMAPGYTDECVEFIDSKKLIQIYPDYEADIKEFS